MTHLNGIVLLVVFLVLFGCTTTSKVAQSEPPITPEKSTDMQSERVVENLEFSVSEQTEANKPLQSTVVPFKMARVWKHSGSEVFVSDGEVPIMRIIFEADGQLVFEGGYEFWNPATWEYNPQRRELQMVIPKMEVDNLSMFKKMIGAGLNKFSGSIKKVDKKRKIIYYNFDETTTDFDFAGYYYFKQ